MTETAQPPSWTARIAEWGGYARDRGAAFALAYWLRWALPFLTLFAFAKAVDVARAVWKGILGFPAWVDEALDTSTEILTTRKGRRALLRAVHDESALTVESRRAILFLGFLFLLVAYVVVELLTVTVFPEVRPFKNQTDVLLFYGIASRLALPTPYELVLLPAAEVLGDTTAIVIASFSALIASWLLFLIGTEANHGMKHWLVRRDWGRRFWVWLERNAHRYGYVLMGVLLSVPFLPDSLTALFALLGLRLRPFLLTIFLSSVARFSIFLWAAHALH